jgi:hypothetical protein
VTTPLPQSTISQQRWPIVDEITLYDVMQALRKDIFSDLRVCVPAQVVSYDGTKQTASVQVLLKRTLSDGRTVTDYPQLDVVPVYTPQGGGAYLQFPVAAGDQGILIFADRNIRSWLQSGAPAPLPTPRMHSLSDGFFIPGINALNSNIPNTPSNKVLLTYQGSTLDLDSSGLKFIGTGGAEVDLQAALVTIKNQTTTLNTLIGQFLTMLEALTVADDEGGAILPLTAASIAAIEAFRAQFAGLLG